MDTLDIHKFKNVPINLINFERKVNKLDVDQLASVPVDSSELIDVVKTGVVKRMVIMII